MFKTLFATTLLLFGCANKCNDQTEYYSNKREAIRDYFNLYGSYNYVSQFNLEYADKILLDYGEDVFSYYFYDDTLTNYDSQVCIIDFSETENINNAYMYPYYLHYIDFHIESDYECFVDYHLIDSIGNTRVVNEQFYLDDPLSDLSYPSMIFDSYNSFFLGGEASLFFNLLYTKLDNQYTTTYIGYYSFNTSLPQLNQIISGFGSFTFNGSIYLSYTNNIQGALHSIDCAFYDVLASHYSSELISVPPINYQDNQFYFNGVKMTLSDYSYLSQVGFFGYVRPTDYDNASFQDLIFSVWDGPLYFIHMLLNFELFGVQLYVAFASLLTVLLVIVCIRKFL